MNHVMLVSIDYENCKCRKKLVDKLVDECTETIEEVKVAKITLGADKSKHKCSSCTLYIVLFSTVFTGNIELVLILFIFIGTSKKMLFVLSFVPILKQ